MSKSPEHPTSVSKSRLRAGGKESSPDRVVLIQTGKTTYRVRKSRIVIGAVESADVRLRGKGVSPIHAVMEVSKTGEVSIFDLASEAGVQINGSKIVSQTLKTGDEIRIGEFNLKWSIQSDRDEEPRENLAPLILEDERFVEEIFDYRPAEKQALEVVMSWYGTILDVGHFVGRREVTIGDTRGNDFAIPTTLASKRYPLVTQSGGGFFLNLEQGIRGVIHQSGQLIPLDTLRAQAPDGKTVQIHSNDFVKLTIGHVDFYISFTAAPPALKRGKGRDKDPFLFRVLFVSLLLTALMIVSVLRMTPKDVIDVEELPERIATILYQPEMFQAPKPPPPPPPQRTSPSPTVTPKAQAPQPKATVKLEIQPKGQPPKPAPKEMTVAPPTQKPAAGSAQQRPAQQRTQQQGREGEGARAKGAEGTRGSRRAAPGKEAQTQARRTSPSGGEGSGGGKSEVPSEGNLDFLKGAGARIENLLGNSAARLGKDGKQLEGFGGFTTQGSGGRALRGGGTGGGGTADTTLGGLGEKGIGGGRVGTGLGAAGAGSNIVGGRARVAIRTGGPEEAVVMGSIDADAVEAALLAHRDEFRLCYEREVNAGFPDLEGRVSTSFVIGSEGRVTEAGVASTTLKNANVERCVLNVIRRIEFPIPRGAGVVQVTYPFKFRPTGGR